MRSFENIRKEEKMRILIIRHGDPDYENDTLTAQGWKEAELLSERLAKIQIRKCYVSPLGRAKDTASLTLKKLGQTAQECEWLREFPPSIRRFEQAQESIVWDWLPQDWTEIPEFYDKDAWTSHRSMEEGGVKKVYDYVVNSFDETLAGHGYVREGNIYRVARGNEDTIAYFCHFGLECVLLSHLLGVSPMPLWHGVCAAPASVTSFITEERRQGIASFRMNSFGDAAHLLMAGEEPSFSARFCERYENMEQRHD